MGIYFNPDNRKFTEDIRSKIYVDKTWLLEELNSVLATNDKCIALSHARRFGKTQAADMIEAYYSCGCDSRELFSQFDIANAEDFEEHLNKYNVIHLDIASITDSVNENVVDEILERLIDDFKEVYSDINYDKPIEVVLTKIAIKSEKQFVIVIDEWDSIIRNYSDKPDAVHEYMQLLHRLFKSMESKNFLALGYMTGILPIKKIKDESALNNFREYTMLDSVQLTKYYGFTEDEVKELCEKYDMPFDEMKKWYNGYLINGIHMYNPNSVCQAINRHKISFYWTNTSSFSSINNYITLNFDGLKENIIQTLSGEQVHVNTMTFSNDLSQIHSKDESLTALIHLGYLAYNEQEDTAYLPNYEIRLAYKAALCTGPWKNIAGLIERSEQLLKFTIDGDEDQVINLVEAVHDTYSSVFTYNNENSLSCVITMAYFTAYAYYDINREFHSGKGFIDFVFVPMKWTDKPPIIIELKYGKSAEDAIKQIKERGYTSAFNNHPEVILVGINYDKDDINKKHTCIIEKWYPDKKILGNGRKSEPTLTGMDTFTNIDKK